MIKLPTLYDAINLSLLYGFRDQSWAWGAKPTTDLMGMLDKLTNLGYRATLYSNEQLITLTSNLQYGAVVVWWPTGYGTFVPGYLKWDDILSMQKLYTTERIHRSEEVASLRGTFVRHISSYTPGLSSLYIRDYHKVDIEQGIDPPETTTVTFLLIRRIINE